MRLRNKTAIVTGAAAGIGRACALRFAAEGANVVAADRNAAGLAETERLLPAGSPGAIVTHVADVSRAADIEALVEATVRRFGRLDVILSNAAFMRDGSVVDLPESDWDDMFATNVKGSFLLGKYAIPAMRNSGGGSFIITASVNGFWVEADIAGYCATKGAVIALTRAMAIDHGPEGVRVNCICPGWIETAMSQPYLEQVPGGRDFAGKIAAVGRIGQPEDIAGVAVFLASDDSAFVTGAAYVADGGCTLGMTKALALS